MFETHNEEINNLFTTYIRRLENDLKHAPPDAMPAIGECITQLYAMKVALSQQDEKGRVEIKIMNNLNNLLRGNDDGKTPPNPFGIR